MEVVENKRVVYEFGRFALDPCERTFSVDGIPVHLPAKEFDTLQLLIEHNGHALSKDEMMAAIWHDSFVDESNLARQISRIRKLLDTNGERYIETLPKFGYRFSARVQRTLVELEDDILLERRTVKRVTFAVEDEIEIDHPALPPDRVRRSWLVVTILLIGLIGFGLAGWYFVYRSRAAVIDPYAPVRLTDNPNDDTDPWWMPDGEIRFVRIFPDNHSEVWTMHSDGTGQEPLKMPEGKRLFGWSPDGQKVQYVKLGDNTKAYLSNTDGSGEILLPFRGGLWSPDSKLLAYHQRLSGDVWNIFVYTVETGEIRNITNSKSFDADPSFSPDSKHIVFASSRDGNPEIYSVNVDGSELRRLTFDPGLDALAGFSPDGTQILFGSNRENENGDVYVMNTDGGGLIKLTNWDKSNESAGRGCWSPDGTKILFTSDRNGKDDIYIMSAETVRPKLVVSEPGYDIGSFSFSPDGKKIVYSMSREDKTGEIKVMDLETNRTSLVRKTEWPLTKVDWSRDGGSILFHDRIEGNTEVCIIKPDGTGFQNLTNDPSQDIDASWSPDATHIVFSTTRTALGPGASAPQLYIMNADGSEPRPLTPKKGWETTPVWSADGNSILFTCDRTDSPGNLMDVCQINIDGTGERRVLFHHNNDYQPAVSPDGKRIAFVATSDSNVEIYTMNMDGSGLSRVTRDPADDTWPHWSPDGSRFYFVSNRGGHFAIYQTELP